MWTPWGPWAHCSAECGGGVHSRSRLCENGSSCPGCSMVVQFLFTKQKWQIEMFQTTMTSRVICWPARTLNLEPKKWPGHMVHPHISEWINPKLRGVTCLASTSQLLLMMCRWGAPPPPSSQEERLTSCRWYCWPSWLFFSNHASEPKVLFLSNSAVPSSDLLPERTVVFVSFSRMCSGISLFVTNHPTQTVASYGFRSGKRNGNVKTGCFYANIKVAKTPSC